MKAFVFRLEQVLRWREVQTDLQKSRVASAAGRLAAIEAGLEARRSELSLAAGTILDVPTGSVLKSYAGFRDRSLVLIHQLEKQVAEARAELKREMDLLVEANRRTRLLERLKLSSHKNWRMEFDRDLAAFVDEAFLRRDTRKRYIPGHHATIEERTGA
jgi:flagellar export protein FliJ